MPDTSLPWASLLALGAMHGINPAMGWLFAVGRALQERDRRALWRAFGPLALGHAAAIGAALTLAFTMGRIMPMPWLRWIMAGALVAVGLHSLVRHRHVRLGGMHVGARELATWSFLVASAHGAGLMVLPFVLGAAAPAAPAGAAHHHHGAPSGAGDVAPLAAGAGDMDVTVLLASLVHTLGYLGVTVLLAVVVYERVGLGVLRRAWINLNVVWAAAMILAAVPALLG